MKYSIIIVLTLTLFSACKDIFDPDLSEESLSLLSPPDNYQSSDYTVLLQWNKLIDAEEYNLRIWDSDSVLVDDIFTDTFKYSYTFTYADTFRWEVNANNIVSETEYVSRYIIILDSDDLSQVTVNINSPADELVTNETAITFNWDTVNNADNYWFELEDENGDYTTYIVYTDSLQLTIEEGVWEWRIRAQNSSTNTGFSSRTLTIDTTAPNMPEPYSPINGDTVFAAPFDMDWYRNGQSGSDISDSLFVSSDSAFATVDYYIATTDSSYEFTDTLSNGSYYWYVKSYDQAGNYSKNSAIENFVFYQ